MRPPAAPSEGWGVWQREAPALIGEIQENYPPFRADAGFANPAVYEFLEAEQIKYAIRLPANRVLQNRIGYLLRRPVERPSHNRLSAVRGALSLYLDCALGSGW